MFYSTFGDMGGEVSCSLVSLIASTDLSFLIRCRLQSVSVFRRLFINFQVPWCFRREMKSSRVIKNTLEVVVLQTHVYYLVVSCIISSSPKICFGPFNAKGLTRRPSFSVNLNSPSSTKYTPFAVSPSLYTTYLYLKLNVFIWYQILWRASFDQCSNSGRSYKKFIIWVCFASWTPPNISKKSDFSKIRSQVFSFAIIVAARGLFSKRHKSPKLSPRSSVATSVKGSNSASSS